MTVKHRTTSSTELPPVAPITALKSPSLDEVLAELLALTRSVSLEMHDEEIVHAYVTSMLQLFPGRLFALRLFDADSGELSLVYATGRLRGDRRDRVRITAQALEEQGLLDAANLSAIEPTQEYLPQFFEKAEGFDVAIGNGRDLTGVLSVEYPHGMRSIQADHARIVHIALQLSASLRNARLVRESLYLRDYLTKLLEHANAPILVIGRKREIRVVNRALSSLTGYRRDELVGRDFASLLDDEERARLLPVLIAALRGQSATGVEVRVPSKLGSPVRLLMNTASVLSADGEVEGVIAIGRDLTEIRELERRVVHAEKLATVGQLAAGVVHELNNPLTSISVYSDYLLKHAEREGAKSGDVHKLRRIHESADRILRFSRELLAYARPTLEEPRLMGLGNVIERSLEYCDYLITERGVNVTVRASDDVPSMLGVAGQLQQVLVNLITNACHAMSRGGAVELSTGLESGEVVIRVRDSGVGIARQDLVRIFEPFFTTKPDGKGTGLGLSIVQGIVENHGGEISVDSEIGRGTVFTLRLPSAG